MLHSLQLSACAVALVKQPLLNLMKYKQTKSHKLASPHLSCCQDFISPERILIFKCENRGWNFAAFTSNLFKLQINYSFNSDHSNTAQSRTMSCIPIIKPWFKVFPLKHWNANWMQPDICEFYSGKNGLCMLWLRCDCFLFLIIYRFIKCFFLRCFLICNHRCRQETITFYFIRNITLSVRNYSLCFS